MTAAAFDITAVQRRRAWVAWHAQSGCPLGAFLSSSPPSRGGASTHQRVGWLASLCNFDEYTARNNHIMNYTVTLSNLQFTDRTLEESETAILGSAAGSLLHQGPDIFSLNDC